MQNGLNRMGRNHVHLAVGLPGNGVISGMRTSCQIVVEVNITKAMHGSHRIPFHISENKVILTEGLKNGSIPPDCFRMVLDFETRTYLYQAPFEYICVYDFECTCTNDKINYPMRAQEIIEFTIVIIDVRRKAIKSTYQTYVKPTIDTQLTPFCMELSGIT